MSGNVNKFLSKALGEDFFEVLAKTELYKLNANIAIDLEDICIGLKVVPRVVMSLLIRELPSMQIGQAKKVDLFLPNAFMNVTKHDTDTYSGFIIQDGKELVNFKYRPLPGVGLVIMSAFELYELEDLTKEPSSHPVPGAELNIQKLIDDRMALHQLIHSVVEQKIAPREALHQMMMLKLTEAIDNMKAEADKKANQVALVAAISREEPEAKKDDYFQGMANGIAVADSIVNDREPKFIERPAKANVAVESSSIVHEPARNMETENINKSVKKALPLKKFLEDKAAKKKGEFEFKMVKGESVECPDCRHNIFDGKLFSSCICYGDDMDKKVFIKKSDDKYIIRFSKGWDIDNIEMLLDVLRKQNG